MQFLEEKFLQIFLLFIILTILVNMLVSFNVDFILSMAFVLVSSDLTERIKPLKIERVMMFAAATLLFEVLWLILFEAKFLYSQNLSVDQGNM